MEERILSAYNYYHNERPGFLVFFKLEEGYTAFHEDARVAAMALRRPIMFNKTTLGSLVLKEYEFFDMLNLLDLYGIHVISVTYRDEDGHLVVPDVEDFVFEDMCVSQVRITDYETSIMWLRDAMRFKINPQIARRLDDEKKPVTGFAIATFQKSYDPYKNPWHI